MTDEWAGFDESRPSLMENVEVHGWVRLGEGTVVRDCEFLPAIELDRLARAIEKSLIIHPGDPNHGLWDEMAERVLDEYGPDIPEPTIHIHELAASPRPPEVSDE